jgi:hypothetical protein
VSDERQPIEMQSSIASLVASGVVGGEDRLAFDVLNGRMTIAANARAVPEEVIVKAVAATGMNAVPWEAHAGKVEPDSHRHQQALFTIASGACVLKGVIVVQTSTGESCRRRFDPGSSHLAAVAWFIHSGHFAVAWHSDVEIALQSRIGREILRQLAPLTTR